ncbi:hypothetical protein GGTG_12505 [Gaeumannomyces tritici R3-111a-1]|uniref:Retrotransposon gag domain-containing protein n=1 Tax=Gaeumannomyces tritici (strain R3-111a-1) TaxID=644352 RepID=J3PG81_GAET3|nr:hypothetical protein GGTG_12505 [Gaeumannomyces tritici R3-111a-1]EJT69621.1 hypothetical protein GGTG_12505 [Gaeumannomyces tritici R3-111a-1]
MSALIDDANHSASHRFFSQFRDPKPPVPSEDSSTFGSPPFPPDFGRSSPVPSENLETILAAEVSLPPSVESDNREDLGSENPSVVLPDPDIHGSEQVVTSSASDSAPQELASSPFWETLALIIHLAERALQEGEECDTPKTPIAPNPRVTMSLNVYTFSGAPLELAQDYLEHIEAEVTCLGLEGRASGIKSMAEFKAGLRGDAREWYGMQTTLAQKRNWTLLRTAFENRFPDEENDDRFDAETKAQVSKSSRLPGKALTTYLTRAKHLNSRVKDTVTRHILMERMITQMVDGESGADIQKQIYNHLLLKDKATWDRILLLDGMTFEELRQVAMHYVITPGKAARIREETSRPVPSDPTKRLAITIEQMVSLMEAMIRGVKTQAPAPFPPPEHAAPR